MDNFQFDIPTSLQFSKNGMDRFDPHVIKVLGDGNCFFHALCRAYFDPYITNRLNGRVISRKEMVVRLREEISQRLEDRIEPNGLSLYETLGKGNISELGKDVNEFSLETMKKHLNSNEHCGEEVHELVSRVLNKNIFFIDTIEEDVYVTTDINILYKEDRTCVVLLYNMEDHYDTCAISQNGSFVTHFKFSNPFIQFLYNRLREKKRE